MSHNPKPAVFLSPTTYPVIHPKKIVESNFSLGPYGPYNRIFGPYGSGTLLSAKIFIILVNINIFK